MKLMRKLLKKHGFAPNVLVTDGCVLIPQRSPTEIDGSP